MSAARCRRLHPCHSTEHNDLSIVIDDRRQLSLIAVDKHSQIILWVAVASHVSSRVRAVPINFSQQAACCIFLGILWPPNHCRNCWGWKTPVDSLTTEMLTERNIKLDSVIERASTADGLEWTVSVQTHRIARHSAEYLTLAGPCFS